MHWNTKNLIGKRFGRLTIIKDSNKRKGSNVIWLCRCSCGNLKEIRSDNLRCGDTQSCGCLQKEKVIQNNKKHSGKHSYSFKHGKRETRLYMIWTAMSKRCFSPKNKAYHRYGGRGIRICDEWKSDFMSFYNWALTHGYADNLTIDRIDNDGNYEPSNCHWITKSENTKKYWHQRYADNM